MLVSLFLLFNAFRAEVIRVNSKADLRLATTDLERRPNTGALFSVQAQEDILMEEMRMRRWSMVKKTHF
jgi:hypothetical protein